MAGTVTVGLAWHWPCVTDFSGFSTYELKAFSALTLLVGCQEEHSACKN